jgi:hypothetical protein
VRSDFFCFIFSCLLFVVGCNDENTDVSPAPFIEEPHLAFVDGGVNSQDTLILSFKFQDGDQDLGLDPGNFAHNLFPYQFGSFFQSSPGGLIEIAPVIETFDDGFYPQLLMVFKDFNPANGKLAFPRTKTQDLPAYGCQNYLLTDFAVALADRDLLDEYSRVTDTVLHNNEPHLIVHDTLYFKINENSFNITVDFLVLQPDGSVQEFDWWATFCVTHDGRFPQLYDDSIRPPYHWRNGPFEMKIKTNTRGELIYRMTSSGYHILFGGKRLKLRFSIKDRALNQSNILETEAVQF